jgi:hypothetical protein
MWNIKCFIILSVTTATGIVTKGLKKYLEVMPGKYPIDNNTCTGNFAYNKESTTS